MSNDRTEQERLADIALVGHLRSCAKWASPDEWRAYIPDNYNNAADAIVRLTAERDTLKAEVERLRALVESNRREMSRLVDRPTTEPGGMECQTCDRIFIGDESHSECGICALKSQLAQAEAHVGFSLEDREHIASVAEARGIERGMEKAYRSLPSNLDPSRFETYNFFLCSV